MVTQKNQYLPQLLLLCSTNPDLKLGAINLILITSVINIIGTKARGSSKKGHRIKTPWRKRNTVFLQKITIQSMFKIPVEKY